MSTIGDELTGRRTLHGPPSPGLQADVAELCKRWRSEGRGTEAAVLEGLLAFELRLHRHAAVTLYPFVEPGERS